MTRSVLPFLLAGKRVAEPSVEHLNSEAVKKAARFWVGKEVNALRKAQCILRLTHALCDGKRVAEVVAALRPQERAVLAVVRRYGGSISGVILRRELLSRGIIKEPTREELRLYRHREADPVLDLCERLVLVKEPARYDSYSYSYSYGSSREYPDVALPARVAAVIEPAASLAWTASMPFEKAPESSNSRAPAQMMVDLEQALRALRSLGRWKVNQGGALPAAVRNRLGKLLPVPANDPFEPPDRVAFDYALLCGLGAVAFDGAEGWLEPDRAERLLDLPHETQVSEWIRAWMTVRLWQDGIGGVPDRDGRDESTRIDPSALRTAREFLVWALTRVAHGPSDWLDLEMFVQDLYAAAGERGLSLYWHGYAWQPRFAGAVGKDKLPAGAERSRAFWLDSGAIWAANALCSTLVHLGVIERGRSGGARSERWCFRLTEVGRAVLGAPEIAIQKPAGRSVQCLTVQPSHDILLYLDVADGPAVTTLGRIASRESAAGIVQTFKLTRDSVYGALEGGMTPAAIESFLNARSRSGLPANVSQSLAEWSRKRDALVVRSAVAVGANLPKGQDALPSRAVGERFVVASVRTAGKGSRDLRIAPEPAAPIRSWKIDDHGVISLGEPMSLIGGARLRRFAVFEGGTWRITPDSVRAARDLGIASEQILEWLSAHLSRELPAVMATAIKNWAGVGGKAFLGDLVVLQVSDPKAYEALRASERLRPFLKGVLPGDCFVVAADKRDQLSELLRELGFALDAACKLEAIALPATPISLSQSRTALRRVAEGRRPC